MYLPSKGTDGIWIGTLPAARITWLALRVETLPSCAVTSTRLPASSLPRPAMLITLFALNSMPMPPVSCFTILSLRPIIVGTSMDGAPALIP